MKEEDFRRLLEETLDNKFKLYGFRVDDPHELQQDMLHLRKLRLGCEATKKNILKAFITVTIPATIYMIWDALKDNINSH